jgi:hypothetical protein
VYILPGPSLPFGIATEISSLLPNLIENALHDPAFREVAPLGFELPIPNTPCDLTERDRRLVMSNLVLDCEAFVGTKDLLGLIIHPTAGAFGDRVRVMLGLVGIGVGVTLALRVSVLPFSRFGGDGIALRAEGGDCRQIFILAKDRPSDLFVPVWTHNQQSTLLPPSGR